MTFHAPISFATTARKGVASMHFLLPDTTLPDIDTIGAGFLAALGENGASIERLRKCDAGQKIALQTGSSTFMVSASNLPLPANQFIAAIAPFSRPKDRAAKMNVIAHHEAFFTLRLRDNSNDAQNTPERLHRAMAGISQMFTPLGLLWRPTGRLHIGTDMSLILRDNAPLDLLLSPQFKTVGPRRLPVVEFLGANEVVGYDLTLHLIDIDRDLAVETGRAFVRAARNDASLKAALSFHRHGRTFRLAHAQDASAITLIPVAEAQVLAQPAA